VCRNCIPPIQTSRLSENEICDPVQLLQVVLTYFDPNQFINSRLSWNNHGPSEILSHMEIYSILRGCLPMAWGCVPEAKSRQGGKFRLDLLVVASRKSWVGFECKVDLDHKGLKAAIDQTSVLTTTFSTSILGSLGLRKHSHVLEHTAKAQNHCCTHPVHRAI